MSKAAVAKSARRHMPAWRREFSAAERSDLMVLVHLNALTKLPLDTALRLIDALRPDLNRALRTAEGICDRARAARLMRRARG